MNPASPPYRLLRYVLVSVRNVADGWLRRLPQPAPSPAQALRSATVSQDTASDDGGDPTAPRPGGPPAYWLERVREGAPELLQWIASMPETDPAAVGPTTNVSRVPETIPTGKRSRIDSPLAPAGAVQTVPAKSNRHPPKAKGPSGTGQSTGRPAPMAHRPRTPSASGTSGSPLSAPPPPLLRLYTMARAATRHSKNEHIAPGPSTDDITAGHHRQQSPSAAASRVRKANPEIHPAPGGIPGDHGRKPADRSAQRHPPAGPRYHTVSRHDALSGKNADQSPAEPRPTTDIRQAPRPASDTIRSQIPRAAPPLVRPTAPPRSEAAPSTVPPQPSPWPELPPVDATHAPGAPQATSNGTHPKDTADPWPSLPAPSTVMGSTDSSDGLTSAMDHRRLLAREQKGESWNKWNV